MSERADGVRVAGPGDLPAVLALGMAVVAPLPFGGTAPAARGAFALVLAVGLAWLWRDRRSLAPPPRPLAVLALATAALALAYLVPLPPAAVEVLSPDLAAIARDSLAMPGEPERLAAAERRLAARAGLERPEPGWRGLSADPDDTLEAATRVLLVLGSFVLALVSTRTHRDRRRLAAAVLVSAFLQAAYALVEGLSGHQHILYRPKSAYAALATGTFVNPNHFAALVSLGLFCLAGLSLWRDDGADEEEPEDRAALLTRAGLVATIAVVLVVAMFWSTSRAALAAGGGGLALLGAWLAWTSRRRGRAAALRVAPALALAAVLLSVAVWVRAPAPLIDEVERVPESLVSRADAWATTLRIVADYPLTGTGPGTFARVHDMRRPPELNVRLGHAHSDYLEWVSETGAPGALLMVLWLAALALGARDVLRQRRGRALSAALAAALTGLAAHEAVDFPLQLPGVAIPAALLAGALVAPNAWGPVPVTPGRRRLAWWTAALALLALALAATGLLTLAQLRAPADRPRAPGAIAARLATAETLRRWSRGQVERVLAAARSGRSLPPEEAVARAGAAVVTLQRAAQRAPLRGEIRMTSWLAAETLMELTGADADGALRELTRSYLHRAERLAPSSRARRLALARDWLLAGDVPEARRVVRALLEMDPRRAREAYALLGGARLGLADLMEATPNRPEPALELARYLLDERGDVVAARIVLERSLARFPAHAPLRLSLAGTLMRERRDTEALAVLDEASPPVGGAERRAALHLRARLLQRLGRQALAEEALSELERLGGDRQLVALARARGWLATEREAEAVELLRTVLARGPAGLPEARRLEAALLLGQTLERRGELREALEAYRVAEEIDPDHPRVRAFMRSLDAANPRPPPG